jgi:hypothetical protein
MKKLFKVTWFSTIIGESLVEADSKAEAKELALAGEDTDFEWFEDSLDDNKRRFDGVEFVENVE